MTDNYKNLTFEFYMENALLRSCVYRYILIKFKQIDMKKSGIQIPAAPGKGGIYCG